VTCETPLFQHNITDEWQWRLDPSGVYSGRGVYALLISQGSHGLDATLDLRLNCSFSPLTFSKLRFWPPKKKTTKQPPKFCNCSSFGPPRQKNFLKKNTWHPLRVPRQRRPSQYQFWGPKLLQLQNLGGCFVVFFS